MYINIDVLSKHNFPWADNEFIVLQIIKQKQYHLLESCSKDILINLFNQGFITKIQPTKKDTPKYLLARLTDKGKKFLKDCEIAEITDESKQLAQKLVSLYENNGLTIDSKKKIVELVSWFCSQVPDVTIDKIYSTVENYINTEDRKFIRSLNNLIWKGESVFSTNWNLSQSKLYTLITK